MRFKYLNWYTQALGSSLGILACMFGCLHGYMFVFFNDPSKYIESIGPLGILSSYLLLPLCLFTLILSIIRSYTAEIEEKELFGFSFIYLNKIIIISTVIVGIIGARHFFVIPAVLILFNQYSYKFKKETVNEEDLNQQLKPTEIDEVIDVELIEPLDENEIVLIIDGELIEPDKEEKEEFNNFSEENGLGDSV